MGITRAKFPDRGRRTDNSVRCPFRLLSAVAAAAIVLSACAGTPDNGSVSGSPSEPQQASQSTTATKVPPISPTPEPQTATPQAGTPIPLTVYYIALDDGGQTGEEVGCGDSLIAAFTEPVTFKDQLKATMDRLLADDNMHHGGSGLYNALYKSDLTFTNGSFSDGTVRVNLKGAVRQSGVCDAPRIQAQLSQAAETAVGADSSVITVNGKPLREVLSSR